MPESITQEKDEREMSESDVVNLKWQLAEGLELAARTCVQVSRQRLEDQGALNVQELGFRGVLKNLARGPAMALRAQRVIDAALEMPESGWPTPFMMPNQRGFVPRPEEFAQAMEKITTNG